MLEDYQPKPRLLWLAALAFFVATVADSWFRWWSFQYHTFDLAFYEQSLWLAAHGQWHTSLLDVPLMGNHAEPICYLLLPFFWFWQHPMFFVVVQALLLATMPFTAYRIARRMEFERGGALWMALATILAPATGFLALHEFHPESLSAPLILFMLEARQSRRPGSFWICFLLAVMCKENVAFMLAWMCAVNWFLDREDGPQWQRNFNLLPGAVALGWVLLYGLWLSPLWNGGKVDYGELYSHLGKNGGEIVGGFFSAPGKALGALWMGATRGNLVWGLLAPFLLLPLLRPRWLLAAAPIFAQHLLSSRPSEWTINFHYAAPLLPLLWMGTAEASANMFWRENVVRWIALACGVGQVLFGPALSIYHTIADSGRALQMRPLRVEMLAQIPKDASVTAGLPYLSHLANRAQLHSLHFTLKGLKTLSRATYTPPQTDIVLVDAADSDTFAIVGGYYHPRRILDGREVPDSDILLHRSLLGASWKIRSINAISLFTRHEGPGPVSATGEGRKLDDFHSLVWLQNLTPAPAGCLRLVFTWELGKDRALVPWARLILEGPGYHGEFEKGPVALGKENGRFAEEWIVSPELPSGKYHGQLIIYDRPKTEPAQPSTFQARLFDIGELSL